MALLLNFLIDKKKKKLKQEQAKHNLSLCLLNISPLVLESAPFLSIYSEIDFQIHSGDPIPRARRRQESHAALFRLSPTGQDRIPQALPIPPALDRWSARFVGSSRIWCAYPPPPCLVVIERGRFFRGGCRF